MLGRQQIAGIPTAISELLKNAHDAYADHAKVDLFRQQSLFVLRDDGMGMTREDYEQRWLTLGTESKLGEEFGMQLPERAPGKAVRPILGEKGIGRLAIAAIGPQVLILTRANVASRRNELLGSFINWGLFALPGVNLDEIEIPVWVFPGGTLPDAASVQEMVRIVRENLNGLIGERRFEEGNEIRAQLDGFAVDPAEVEASLGSPSLTSGSGTHFFISPVDDSLLAAIDAPDSDDTAPPLTKMLIGFTNTMTPDHAPPRIVVDFRDHRTPEVVEELISEGEFFTPKEFENADHHIAGTFDEYGQFRGTVAVYGEESSGHIVTWPSHGRRTDCGPFRIDVAVIQGLARESTVPDFEWARMIRKLNRIGGLYIYKDGIRVLPYGNNDYDFLDIERNRTKSASYYYFSFRRIFGVIEIDSVQNAALSEKAGREGFRENSAYRQFRDILKNFFVQIAADFFREGGPQATRYEERRAELDRLERARRKRERLTTSRRAELRGQIEGFFADVESGGPVTAAAGIVANLKNDLAVASAKKDSQQAAAGLMEAESNARRAIAELSDRYRIALPRGVGLPRQLRRDVDYYRDRHAEIQAEVFEPTMIEVEKAIVDAEVDSKVRIARQLRFERALQAVAESGRRDVQSESREAQNAAHETEAKVADVARQSVADIARTVQDVLSEASSRDVTLLSDEEFVRERTRLEGKIVGSVEEHRRLLSAIAAQLRMVSPEQPGVDGQLTELDATEALEEEVLALRERSEADLELAQLGMAIQVITHEFDASIRAVRNGLRELNAWADANDDLRGLYERLRTSFEHLDGYLTLFTPLQRRLYRKPVRIVGGDVHKFLRDLFEERLKRHEVDLRATSKFRRHSLVAYPSTFYPVFVNLVDNAIFWLSRSKQPRVIELDAADGAMLVSDTGSGVPDRDRESIFELGFTRKPSGRGMGLYISRDVLARAGYSLALVERPDWPGATFRIGPTPGVGTDADG
jgi:signal transduction histidine kinase